MVFGEGVRSGFKGDGMHEDRKDMFAAQTSEVTKFDTELSMIRYGMLSFDVVWHMTMDR